MYMRTRESSVIVSSRLVEKKSTIMSMSKKFWKILILKILLTTLWIHHKGHSLTDNFLKIRIWFSYCDIILKVLSFMAHKDINLIWLSWNFIYRQEHHSCFHFLKLYFFSTSYNSETFRVTVHHLSLERKIQLLHCLHSSFSTQLILALSIEK